MGLTFDVCDAQLSTNFVSGVKTLAGELGKTDNLYTNLAQSFLPTFGAHRRLFGWPVGGLTQPARPRAIACAARAACADATT